MTGEHPKARGVPTADPVAKLRAVVKVLNDEQWPDNSAIVRPGVDWIATKGEPPKSLNAGDIRKLLTHLESMPAGRIAPMCASVYPGRVHAVCVLPEGHAGAHQGGPRYTWDQVSLSIEEHLVKGLVSAGSSTAVNPRDTVGGSAEPSGPTHCPVCGPTDEPCEHVPTARDFL